MLHGGHVAFGEEAAGYGICTSDQVSMNTVWQLKGRRTINNNDERLYKGITLCNCMDKLRTRFEKEVTALKPDGDVCFPEILSDGEGQLRIVLRLSLRCFRKCTLLI